MKVVFVGGGSGGHFYPLIAVAEAIEYYAHKNQLIKPSFYYMGPRKFDEKALYSLNMKFVYCPAAKLRRTRDIPSRILNFFSFFNVSVGVLKAVVSLFIIFPDVVFSKGGYTSFPVLMAARFLRIPVVIHDSDAALGRVSAWSASFARQIGIAYTEAESTLTEKQKEKAALVGVPVRRQLLYNPMEQAYDIFGIEKEMPTILVVGGSQGAQYVNEAILDALPKLLKKYQIIHQTGADHIELIEKETKSMLRNMESIQAYRPSGFLDEYHMRAAYTVADLVITRAGSTSLFEIAEWGKPAIIIPIPADVSHDQKKNAYAYARATGATVIEQQNLTPNLFLAEIENILGNEEEKKKLGERAKAFATPDADDKIARQIVRILQSHE